ncbi:hypothetical protein MTO96_008127 [Rhipicephalus appendiculatus]
MPAYCCVPLCKQYGYLDSCGCKVSFHRFPNDPEMRKKWLVAIKREGPLIKCPIQLKSARTTLLRRTI